jgi:hypothetical protein
MQALQRSDLKTSSALFEALLHRATSVMNRTCAWAASGSWERERLAVCSRVDPRAVASETLSLPEDADRDYP